jgi:gamma-glutamyl phosphate reductase
MVNFNPNRIATKLEAENEPLEAVTYLFNELQNYGLKEQNKALFRLREMLLNQRKEMIASNQLNMEALEASIKEIE